MSYFLIHLVICNCGSDALEITNNLKIKYFCLKFVEKKTSPTCQNINYENIENNIYFG